jgi:hypothetical protein
MYIIINSLNTIITIIFQQKNNLVLELNQQAIRPYTSQLMEILKALSNKMVVAGIFLTSKRLLIVSIINSYYLNCNFMKQKVKLNYSLHHISVIDFRES